MKILYAAGNRTGADIQLYRFLENLPSKHTVKIAAYLRSSNSIHTVDWILNAFTKRARKKAKVQMVNQVFRGLDKQILNIYINDIKEYSPDVIVCDYEFITSFIAKQLGIKLWYCSPIHLINGIKWKIGENRKCAPFIDTVFNNLTLMPKADKYLVYSAFGDVFFRPELKDKYSWVKPYHVKAKKSKSNYDYLFSINEHTRFAPLNNIIRYFNYKHKSIIISPFGEENKHIDYCLNTDYNNYSKYLYNCKKVFTTGDSNAIADAIYNNKNICISPDWEDTEASMNYTLLDRFDFSSALPKVELMDKYSLEYLEKGMLSENQKDFVNEQGTKYLHQLLEEEI